MIIREIAVNTITSVSMMHVSSVEKQRIIKIKVCIELKKYL